MARCYSPRYTGAKCRSDLRGWIAASSATLNLTLIDAIRDSHYRETHLCSLNSGASKSGDVKATIRSAPRYRVKSNEVACSS